MGMSGNIQTVPLVDLLQWITSDNRTGCLILKREGQERRVFFKKGRVISFSSSDERDRFGQFLVHAGYLTPISLAQVLDEQKKAKKALGRALVDLGIMSEADVKAKLRLHAMELCTALFLWKEGDFEFVHQDVEERDFVSFAISADEILLEAHRRIDEWGRIKSVFPRDDMVPKLDPERALKALTAYDSNSVEYMLLEHIDGRRTISDLYFGIPASEFVLYEALYRLHSEGTISVSDKPAVRDITGEFMVPSHAVVTEEEVDAGAPERPAAPASGPQRTEEVAMPFARQEAPPKAPEPPPPPRAAPAPPPPTAVAAPSPAQAPAQAKESRKEKKDRERREKRDTREPEKPAAPPPPVKVEKAAPREPERRPPAVKPEPVAAPAAPAAGGGSKMGIVVGAVVFLVVVGVVVAVLMRGGKGPEGGPTPSPTAVTPDAPETPPTVATTTPPTPPVTEPTAPPTASKAEEAAALVKKAEAALGAQKLADAEEAANAALALDPGNAKAKAVLAKLDQLQTAGKAGQFIAQAKAQERSGNLDGAEKLYREALAADPGNSAAEQGLKTIATKREKEKSLGPVLDALDRALKGGDAGAARTELTKAEAIDRTDARVVRARDQLKALEDKARDAESKQKIATLLADAGKAIDAGDLAKAEQAIASVKSLDRGHPQIAGLESRIAAAKAKPAGRIEVGEPLLTGVGYAPLKFASRGLPEYPAAALAAKTNGKLMISVQVAPDGSVKDAKLVKSAPAETGFNEAVLKAAKGWKFQPPAKDGGGPATEDTMWSVVVKFEP